MTTLLLFVFFSFFLFQLFTYIDFICNIYYYVLKYIIDVQSTNNHPKEHKIYCIHCVKLKLHLDLKSYNRIHLNISLIWKLILTTLSLFPFFKKTFFFPNFAFNDDFLWQKILFL